MKKTYIVLLLCLCIVASSGQSLRERLKNGGQYNVALISAHRGGFYDSLPENSIAAIDYTISHSIDLGMVEFDLRMTKDGTLFLMHDELVDRTTSGHGRISELSDAYVKSLFLKNSLGHLTSERIPTWEAFLTYASAKSVLLMLDVKADIWKEAIGGLRDHHLVERSIVLTFKPADARRVHELSPEIYISCLVTNERQWEAIQRLSIPHDKLIAYVNDKVSNDLTLKLKNLHIPMMMDVSEHTNHSGQLLEGESYRSLLVRLRSGILITDFPAAVSLESAPH